MIADSELPDLKAAFDEVLQSEGFRPGRDDDDDIRFKCEGWCLCLEFDGADAAYVRLMCPWFWKTKDCEEMPLAHVAASSASKRCKGVKVYCADDGAWATVEFLVDAIETVTAEKLSRMISMIQAGIDAFFDEHKELKAECDRAIDSIKH